MISPLQWLARARPRLLSGLWFALAAALLASPLAAMGLLMATANAATGEPVGVLLAFAGAALLLPVGLATGAGATLGAAILRMPRQHRWRAAGVGAGVAAATMAAGAILLEVLPRLLRGWLPASGGGGDVPGAAAAVGYFCLLPLGIVSGLLAGAAAGLLLHTMAGEPGAATGRDELPA